MSIIPRLQCVALEDTPRSVAPRLTPSAGVPRHPASASIVTVKSSHHAAVFPGHSLSGERKVLRYRYCGVARVVVRGGKGVSAPLTVNVRCNCDLAVSVPANNSAVEEQAREFATKRGRMLLQQQIQNMRPSLVCAMSRETCELEQGESSSPALLPAGKPI